MKVGFIGVGNIGKPMAEQLAQLPFELTVFDVSSAATDAFASKAKVAASPAELGRDVEQRQRDTGDLHLLIVPHRPVARPFGRPGGSRRRVVYSAQ